MECRTSNIVSRVHTSFLVGQLPLESLKLFAGANSFWQADQTAMKSPWRSTKVRTSRSPWSSQRRSRSDKRGRRSLKPWRLEEAAILHNSNGSHGSAQTRQKHSLWIHSLTVLTPSYAYLYDTQKMSKMQSIAVPPRIFKHFAGIALPSSPSAAHSPKLFW